VNLGSREVYRGGLKMEVLKRNRQIARIAPDLIFQASEKWQAG